MPLYKLSQRLVTAASLVVVLLHYTATVPLSLAAAYENLAVKLGRTITDEDKENAAHIYTMIAGNANGSDGSGASGGTIQIDYGVGTGSTELDTSGFTNPAGKNAADLVQYDDRTFRRI